MKECCCCTKSKALIILALLLCLGAVWYLSAKGEKRPPNIVVLMLDTLRADHLSLYGYERETTPILDAFAKENINFNYAITASPWTPPSIATMFTGLYPTAHGMMPPNSRDQARKMSTQLGEHLETLAEIFQKNGYQTGAVTPNPWMKKEFGYQQGFDTYKYFHRVRAEKINEEGIKVLEAFDADQPFLLYLHYLDPHNPYRPVKEFDIYKGPLKAKSYPEKQTRIIGLYDGEIRYLDAKLGELFEYFKQKGLYDDLAILIVSDHGEQFMEHGYQGHGHNTYNEEAHVPLMLKYKNRSYAVDTTVSTIDVFPTALELAGIDIPANTQGISLLNTQALKQRSGVLSEVMRRQNEKAFVNSLGDKVIFKYDPKDGLVLQPGQKTLSASLYNRFEDYAEVAPIRDDALTKILTTDFHALYQETLKRKPAVVGEEVEIGEDTVEELESLGYL
ncbi:sulfatase [Oligoflexia bacterium]|nr:sulfatase [Oligoflexia bacterium]